MKIKLDKKDYWRSLLTDTSPGDVPSIFSNEGFYINSKIYSSGDERIESYNYIKEIFGEYISNKKRKGLVSIPFKYKIYKDGKSLRILSLLHPSSQFQIVELYRDYSPILNNLCTKSSYSIRAPVKVANSFYINGSERNISGDYKSFDIDTIESELYKRRASSYFSYKGVTRLYKLYNSNHYLELEKKYSNMWMLDISNCFNSIYTHSIGWAINNKEYSKYYASKRISYMSEEIDSLVRRSNHNETNGLPIGNEFSRVVAEIIFQEIDLKIEKFLEDKFDLFYGQEYEVIRYVDDYIVYSNSEDTLDIIVKAIGDQLSDFNLFLNDSKFEKFYRPILTDNSSLIISLKDIVSELDEVVFSLNEEVEEEKVVNEVRNIQSVKLAFIDKIKRACMLSSSGYGIASSFLISVFGRRVKRIIEIAIIKIKKGLNLNDKDFSDEAISVRSCLQLFMELIFYFYSVCPTLNSSTNLSKSMILLDRFVASYIPKHLDYLRTSFSFDIENILKFEDRDGYLDNYISLEKMNILLSVSEYDVNKYGVDLSIIESILNTAKKDLGYFEIISLLYYCKDRGKYLSINKSIQGKCYDYLDYYLNNDSLYTSSEALHLSLDLIGCPYIDIKLRKKSLKLVLKSTRKKRNKEVLEILDKLKERYWFVKWKDGDIYDLLVRKSLKETY